MANQYQLIVSFWKYSDPNTLTKAGEWIAVSSDTFDGIKSAPIDLEKARQLAFVMGAVVWTSHTRS